MRYFVKVHARTIKKSSEDLSKEIINFGEITQLLQRLERLMASPCELVGMWTSTRDEIFPLCDMADLWAAKVKLQEELIQEGRVSIAELKAAINN